MKTVQDLIARIHDLDATLEWQQHGTDYLLVSTETTRVIDRLEVADEGGFYNGVRHDGTYADHFMNLQTAQQIIKFRAIQQILSETLQRRYIQ